MSYFSSLYFVRHRRHSLFIGNNNERTRMIVEKKPKQTHYDPFSMLKLKFWRLSMLYCFNNARRTRGSKRDWRDRSEFCSYLKRWIVSILTLSPMTTLHVPLGLSPQLWTDEKPHSLKPCVDASRSLSDSRTVSFLPEMITYCERWRAIFGRAQLKLILIMLFDL